MKNPKHLFHGNPAYYLNRSYMVNNLFYAAKSAIRRGVLKGECMDNKVLLSYRNRCYTIEVEKLSKSISMYYFKKGKKVQVTYEDIDIYRTIYESLKSR